MARPRKYPTPSGEVRGYHMTEDEAAVKLIDLLLFAELQPLEYDSSKNHEHHIIPRCMNGTNDPSNLVVLEHGEHVEMHFALAFYFDKPKLWVAANAMVSHPIYARVFPTEQRIAMAATAASKHAEGYRGEGNPMFGRTGERAPMFGRGDSSAGENNGMFGKKGVHCPTSRANPNSKDVRARISASLVAKNPIRGPTISKLQMHGIEVLNIQSATNYRQITDPVSGASIRIKATRLDHPGAAEEILAELRKANPS